MKVAYLLINLKKKIKLIKSDCLIVFNGIKVILIDNKKRNLQKYLHSHDDITVVSKWELTILLLLSVPT